MFNLWHKMMKKVYDWTMRIVAGPKAFVALCVMAFAESSFKSSGSTSLTSPQTEIAEGMILFISAVIPAVLLTNL